MPLIAVQKVTTWFTNNPDDEQESRPHKPWSAKDLLGKSWTGRRVARVLFPDKYDTEALKAEDVPPLQMHKVAEARMWDSLTDEERGLCEERAKTWEKGIDILLEDHKKFASLLSLIWIVTFVG